MELFDSKILQRLLHSSFVPAEKENLRLFLQKFDRSFYHPKKKSSFWHVDEVYKKFKFQISFFGLFFVVSFTQDKEIVKFRYILLNLSLKKRNIL